MAVTVILGALAVGGCKEEPSWAARWRIAPREGMVVEPTTTEDDQLLNSVECSRVGVSVINFGTVVPIEELEDLVPAQGDLVGFADNRVKPCWSHSIGARDRVFGGPALAPGDYELVTLAMRSNGQRWCAPGPAVDCTPPVEGEVVGVCTLERTSQCESGVRDRATEACAEPCPADQVWSFVDGCYTACVPEAECSYCTDPFWLPRCWEGEGCHPSFASCDCHAFTVVDGETTQIRDIVMQAPPECEDGIDSDGDGLVDDRDPGCVAGDREDVDIVTAQLVVDFTLLSSNEAASCVGVQVSRFEIMLDGQVVSAPQCEIGSVGVNVSIVPGLHEVAVRALAFDGEPLTRTKTFTVEAFLGGVLQPQLLEVDFADTDFLDPIESEAQFVVGYTATEELAPRYCVAGGSGAPGQLDIGEVTMRFLDAAGNPVQPAPLVVAGDPLIQGERLDGSPMPCTQQRIITDPLLWGAYRVEVEAFSPEGELCFSNVDAPTLLAPSVRIDVDVPRVLPLAESCRDCNGDDACGSNFRCDDGICVRG